MGCYLESREVENGKGGEITNVREEKGNWMSCKKNEISVIGGCDRKGKSHSRKQKEQGIIILEKNTKHICIRSQKTKQA